MNPFPTETNRGRPAHFATNSPLTHRISTAFSPILGIKPIESPPPPKKKQQRDESILDSVEESGLRRWRTALWTQSRPGGGRLAIQVGQDYLNHRRIFNASNDLELTGAALAGFNIDIA